MTEIKNEVAEKKVWISIDETLDPKGRQVANVIAGFYLLMGQTSNWY